MAMTINLTIADYMANLSLADCKNHAEIANDVLHHSLNTRPSGIQVHSDGGLDLLTGRAACGVVIHAWRLDPTSGAWTPRRAAVMSQFVTSAASAFEAEIMGFSFAMSFLRDSLNSSK